VSVRWVPVGDVLEEANEVVHVEASSIYPIAGVLGHGRGMLARSPIVGADTSYTWLTRIRAGQVIYSRLKAFEGALAFVGTEHDGMYVSQEFPAFNVDHNQVDSAWVVHLLQSAWFRDAVSARSYGVGARRERLAVDSFLAIRVPLPGLDEQRSIAARLDTVAAFGRTLVAASESRLDAHLLAPPLTQDVFDRSGIATVPARELYSTVSDIVHPGDDLGPARRFVGLEHIEPHTGRRLGELPIQELTGRKLRFVTGDVLYGYLRPYQNKVWLADGPGLCSVEQYVLRPKAGVDPRLLAHALRAERTLAAVNAATHHLQLPRVRTALLGAVEVPDVRGAAHLVDPLEGVNRRVLDLIAATARQRSALRALLPAARNEEFSHLVNS
jgi:hypothetical protein